MNLSWTTLIGWFQIGWTAELSTRSARPLRFFGRDLVAWMGPGGQPVVADAHCPHMGAHLGYGSAVDNGCVRCPLHGWTWGPDGSNRAIPSTGETSGRQLRVVPTAEYRGALFMWHDPLNGPPQVDLVEELSAQAPTTETESHLAGGFPAAARVHPGLTIHPQVAIEDRVDVDHFAGPHSTGLPDLLSLELRDHSFTAVVAHSGGKAEPGAYITSRVVGVGLSLLSIEFGDQTTDILLGVTPVDDGHSDVMHTVWCRSDSSAPDVAESALAAVVPLMRKELEHDLVVWEHLEYSADVPSEHFRSARPLAAVRDWASRFSVSSGAEDPHG
jgi:nitrite reductase/ring-hydroxylating ferredoxin subunit